MMYKKTLFTFTLFLFFSLFFILSKQPTYAANSLIVNISSSTTGGALPANTYSYEVTSTNSSVETSPSNYQTVVNTGSTSSESGTKLV